MRGRDETDAADRERFTRRLEAFSDIVFGFALAQCAFALEVPATLDQLRAHLSELTFFTITFALVAVFWTMHYRIFHYAFRAERIDVVLNFVLLAVVALLPYALRLYVRFSDSVAGSMAYAAALGVGFTLMAVLEWRGLREPPRPMSERARRIITKAVLRHGPVGLVFVCSIPAIAYFGLPGRLVWVLVAPAILVARLVERRAIALPGTPAAAAES